MPTSVASGAGSFVSRGSTLIGFCAPWLAIGAIGLLGTAASNPAKAVTSIQTFTQTDTFTNFTASSTQAIYQPPIPSFSVQPFNAALGTLTSTTIVWNTSASFTGTVGLADSIGSVSFSLGGNYYSSNSGYGGNGTGDGSPNVGSGNPIALSITPYGNTKQFLSSDAGVTYDPNIYNGFVGTNPYTIAHANGVTPTTTPYEFRYTNISTGTVSFTSTATVTYDYVPAPSAAAAPGPLPLLGAGAAWGWSRRLRRRTAPHG